MQMFTIDNENNITALLPGQEMPPAGGCEIFTSAADLHNLLSDWPMQRLLDTWNSIPGFKPVKKFMDRKTAVSRIWKAAQSLVPGAQAAAEAPEAQNGHNGSPEAEAAAPKPTVSETAKALAKKDRAKRTELKKQRAETARKGFAKAQAGRKAAAAPAAKGGQGKGPKDLGQKNKTAIVMALISRPNGATLAELMKETGWMAHSIRGMISTIQSKGGVKIESTKPEGGERTYKVTAPARKAKAGK